MNLLLLLLGMRAWSGSPVEIVTRIWCAVSLLSLEMQLATWTGLATLRTLPLLNVVVAIGLFVGLRHDAPRVHVETTRFRRSTWVPTAAFALFVFAVTMAMPLKAADLYHLERVSRIARVGTLAYEPADDLKLNVLGWTYELVLADTATLPGIGTHALKLHGMMGLALFILAIAAMLQFLGASPPLAWVLLLSVPVAFHQLVLVKNDLFGAIPGLVVLAWIVVQLPRAAPLEVAWATWLTGVAVGMKLTSFPLALVAGGAIVLACRRDRDGIVAAVAGGACGLIAGGLLFTLVENHRVYGAAVEPFRSLGNRTTSVPEAFESIGRFGLSLFDLGTLTRTWWPGRGGWGATYGLPFVWALIVMVYERRHSVVRRTLVVTGAYFLAFAAVYPDADLAHRLALAPGLLVIAVAAVIAHEQPRVPEWLRKLGFATAALSALQIARSAALYLQRA